MKTNDRFKQTEIGMIPEDWEVKELGECFKVNTGEGVPPSKRLLKGKYPLMGGNGIIGYTDDFLVDGEYILTGRVGTIGEVNFKRGKLWISDNAMYVGSNNGNNLKFIYYFLKKFDFTFLNVGSTQPLIKQSDLKKLKIPSPKNAEQSAIATILSGLDSKIELNQNMNKILEAIGQAIFKHWFIDFEFTNEEGKPYKSSGGEMVDSELGEIPKGWKVGKLQYYCNEITRGFTTTYVEKSNLINLNQKANRGECLDKSNYKYYPEEADIPKSKFAKKGDILINSLGQGTLGRVHLFWEDTNNVVVDQHITIIRTKKEIIPEFLYLYLIYPPNKKRLENQITGSTGMLMLNISKIRDFEVLVPSANIMQKFSSLTHSIYSSKTRNIKENENLSQIRDSLLPKLMSGKIRVPVEVRT